MLRHLEAGHIILADRLRILRILGLLARVDAAGHSIGIESRARGIYGIPRRHPNILAGLVWLSGARRVCSKGSSDWDCQ